MRRLWIAAIAALAAFGGLIFTAEAAPAAGLATGAQNVKNITTPENRFEKAYYYHRRHYRHRGYYRHHYYRRPYRRHYYRSYYYGNYPYYYWNRYYW